MTYAFHPAAREDLSQAMSYYEEKQPGLGLEFAAEVHAAIKRIMDHPTAWSVLSPNTRRCLTRRFPFGVIYQTTPTEILIIALMHLNRRPGYYLDSQG